jgi:hypothetical protein|tara:strand:- start:119 stop:352 length:234 start_codon:yes stop_codon:yes gene_type:complete
MSTLTDLVNSGNEDISFKATALLEVEEGLKRELISKAEAKELLEDIKRTTDIEEGSSDVVLKGMLLSSVAVLMELVL